jgi:exonuclease SbcD
MKILHTSDWHVGKSIRTISRLGEHRAVLAEIRDVADREAVDVVVVAGDVFETASPRPDAAAVAYRALLDLAQDNRRVVVIGGNHDSQAGLDALRPLFHAAGVVVLGQPALPESGGVVTLPTRSGQAARLALLPFPSKRYVIKAEALMGQEARDNVATYAETVRRIITTLTSEATADTVNVLVAHIMVRGAVPGGGEREAQLFDDYAVDPGIFPTHLHYVALGHLHRHQSVGGLVPAYYSGSPLQLDFGETRDEKSVTIVEADPGRPAVVRAVPLTFGRRLRTVHGTLAELTAQVGTFGDDYLRVMVREQRRPTLADEVRDVLGDNAVDIRVETDAAQPLDRAPASRTSRSHHELFAEFLAERGHDDPRMLALFDELLDEATQQTPVEIG